MNTNSIYTIGYGNRLIEEFIKLLHSNGILYLIDIRTNPKSSYDQSYIRKNLSKTLKDSGITYVFMGDSLGGLPPEEECYTNGKVDYQKVELQQFYQKGIDRLVTANKKDIPVALMCSELKPESCHRTKLVGQTLTNREINVSHIDENGKLKSQDEIIERITGGQLNLFDNGFTSRKRYK